MPSYHFAKPDGSLVCVEIPLSHKKKRKTAKNHAKKRYKSNKIIFATKH